MSTNSLSKKSGEEIKLVEATDADDDFLAELYFSTRSEEFSAVGWDEAQLRQFLKLQYDYQKQAYPMQFSAPEHSVIRRGDEKIGRLIVNRTETEIRLVDISLLPPFRRAGIGTRIITTLIAEAAEKDLPLTLQVAAGNQAALRLYRKLGFRVTGEDQMNISMQWQADFGF